MRRAWRRATLTLAVGAALAAASHAAAALELGALRLQSQRGQPLRATIPLLQIDAHAAATLRLRIAPAADYAARQLDWNPQLAGLTLQTTTVNGALQVELRSAQPLQLPAFDLLLQADWAGGSAVKAYTVVLPAAGSELAGVPAAAPGSTYTVRRGDTLSALARSLPQAADIDQARLLLALQQDNPDAFADHNVNRLLAGATLQLPSPAQLAAQAAALDPAAARQQLQLQDTDWHSWREHLANTATALPAGDRHSSGAIAPAIAPASAPRGDRLKLSAVASGAAGSAVGAQAEADLIAAQQQSEQLHQQLQTLDARVAALSKLVHAASAAAPASRPRAALQPGALWRQWLAPLAGIALVLAAAVAWLRRSARAQQLRELPSDSAAPMPDYARDALALDLNLGPATTEPAQPPQTDAGADDGHAAGLAIDLSGVAAAGSGTGSADGDAPVPVRPLFDLSSISLDLDPPEPELSGPDSVTRP